MRAGMTALAAAAVFLALSHTPGPALAGGTTLMFAGHAWHVRSGEGGPGPNAWNPDNAFVDPAGDLHLLITRDVAGAWSCAEVWTDARFGHGSFAFEVVGRLDGMDPRAVLGLFTYGPPVSGPDGTNEVDIEVSQWSVPGSPAGHFTVYPAVAGPGYTTHAFDIPATTLASTLRFDWQADHVSFSAWDDAAAGSIHAWTFQPDEPLLQVPQASAPVHINLWLDDGAPPLQGLPVHVVLRGATFG